MVDPFEIGGDNTEEDEGCNTAFEEPFAEWPTVWMGAAVWDD